MTDSVKGAIEWCKSHYSTSPQAEIVIKAAEEAQEFKSLHTSAHRDYKLMEEHKNKQIADLEFRLAQLEKDRPEVPDGYVAIPKNADAARMMILLGHKFFDDRRIVQDKEGV